MWEVSILQDDQDVPDMPATEKHPNCRTCPSPSWAALSSTMSKNRPNQDIEGKWGDLSNAFKTIERQGTEISLVHGANGQMTIGKSNFEKGMTTYAQKWKRAEIYKRKSTGGLQAKNKNMIVVPHHPKENIGVVLIHQYYQQIIR